MFGRDEPEIVTWTNKRSDMNNRRKPMDDGSRFRTAMGHVFGHRLTYAQLTGKDIDLLHQEEAGPRPA